MAPNRDRHAPVLFGEQMRTSTGAVRVNALDGARGFFVSLVLLYHFGVTALVGGWVGINHFFVFSAYLIGRLLSSEKVRTGTIDVAGFYLRRIRRIFPAVLVTLGAVGVYGLLVADPYERKNIGADILATLGFVQNWNLIARDDFYFDQVGNPSLLRHMWTLAVEEQFYVVVPILVALLFAAGRRRATRVAVASALAVGATVWGMHVARGDSLSFSRLYYGTDTRAAALFVGVALAFLMGRGYDGRVPVIGDRRVVAVLGTAGFVATLLPFFFVSETSTWLFGSGGILLLALAAGALLVMLADPRPMPLKAFFSWMPFVHLGRMTLGLYVYHWPIHVWTRGLLDGVPLVVSVLVQAALTVAAATVSFRYLEVPVVMRGLRGLRPRLRQPVAVGAAAVLVVGLAGLALRTSEPPGGGDTPSLVADQQAWQAPSPPVRATVVGDSVGVSLGAGWTAEDYPGLVVDNQSRIGCDLVGHPAVGDSGPVGEEPACASYRQDWATAVAEHDSSTLVVLSGMQMMIAHDVDGTTVEPRTPAGADLIRGTLDDIEREARAAGATRTVVVGMPCRQIDALRLDKRLRFFAEPGSDPANVAWLNDTVRSWAAAGPGRQFADVWEPLCGEGYQPTIHGVRLYQDTVHLTPEGAAMVWTWLGPQIAASETS